MSLDSALAQKVASERLPDPVAASTDTFGKEEAAQFLGVSSRALERYTAAGRVTVGYQPGRTRSVAVYARAELERLKSELQRPLLRGASVGASTSDSPSGSDSLSISTVGERETPTRTATTPTEGAELPLERKETEDRQSELGTSPNPDIAFQEVSDGLVTVSSGTAGGANNALDVLTRLVLERLLERLHSEAALQTVSTSTASASGSTANGGNPMLVLAPVVPRTPQAALGEKLLLSLPEAAALSGLSRARLKKAITEGALVAKPIGRLWRVKRADLDAFIAAL